MCPVQQLVDPPVDIQLSTSSVVVRENCSLQIYDPLVLPSFVSFGLAQCPTDIDSVQVGESIYILGSFNRSFDNISASDLCSKILLRVSTSNSQVERHESSFKFDCSINRVIVSADKSSLLLFGVSMGPFFNSIDLVTEPESLLTFSV